MAQGDLFLFEEFSLTISDLIVCGDDTFKLGLVTSAVVPTAADGAPAFGDYTEVSGTNYTAGGYTLTTTWTEASGTATFDATGSPAASWTKNASGPTNIAWGIVYSSTSTADNAVCAVDFDGPISLVDGDITWEPHASGIFTLS